MSPKVALFSGLISHDRVYAPGGDIHDEIALFSGVPVRVSINHQVLERNPARWGCGSCGFQPHTCPYGHHIDTTLLYQYSAEGVFTLTNNGWFIHKPNGVTDSINMDAIINHHCTIVFFDVSQPMPQDHNHVAATLQSYVIILRGMK